MNVIKTGSQINRSKGKRKAVEATVGRAQL